MKKKDDDFDSTARLDSIKNEINSEMLEKFINNVIEKNSETNLEFRNSKFGEINSLNLKNTKPRTFYKLSFIKCRISKNSVLKIVDSMVNLSQLDLSENSFTQEEVQSICDNLNYLDFIYFFGNRYDLSKVNSANLII